MMYKKINLKFEIKKMLATVHKQFTLKNIYILYIYNDIINILYKKILIQIFQRKKLLATLHKNSHLKIIYCNIYFIEDKNNAKISTKKWLATGKNSKFKY